VAARVAFRGGWTCSCVAISLPWVEADMIRRQIIQQSIDVLQLGWRGDVSASAGTHDEGGCTDVGQWSTAAIQCWREWGWTMQRRDLIGIKTHGHGWPYGCPHLAPAAQAQARDWDDRRNGLVSNGPVVGKWPVKRWDDALDERKQIIMTFVDDVAERVLKIDGIIPNVLEVDGAGDFTSLATAIATIERKLRGMPDAPTATVIADTVLRRDGVIENPDETSDNKFIALATAFTVLYDRQEAEVSATKAQIDALSKKLDALLPAPTVADEVE
jgi:hypothetical protein